MISLVTAGGSGQFTAFAWRLMIVGAGSGLVMATSSTVAVASVPGELAGMAGAANNALRQLGAALGAAVPGAVLQARLHAGATFPAAMHTCAAVLAGVLLTAALVAVTLLRRPAWPAARIPAPRSPRLRQLARPHS
jgi:predicted MFS family arabinose efflux permease